MPSRSPRRNRAITELAARSPALPAGEIVDGLAAGLTQLRDLLTGRLHKDVESLVTDSMLAPSSGTQAMTQLERASQEIDAYAALVVADEVAHGGYLDGPTSDALLGKPAVAPKEWLLDWLLQLRTDDALGSSLKTYSQPYGDLPDKDRRLRLASKLQRAVPASIRTPAVIYHLFPLSVRIVAALAFGNITRAEQLRSEQIALLPAIRDCGACHGRVLDIGASCATCGNPLWNFAWLRVV